MHLKISQILIASVHYYTTPPPKKKEKKRKRKNEVRMARHSTYKLAKLMNLC